MAKAKRTGRIAQAFLVLWFASLTSCGSVLVVAEAGSLCGPLGLPWTCGLVTGNPFAFLWIYLALLVGIAAWLAPATVKGEPILRDATFFETFVYVMMLAITAGAIVFGVVLPMLALEWVLARIIPEAAALATSAATVIPLFFFFRHRRLAKRRTPGAAEAGSTPGPSAPQAHGAQGRPPGSKGGMIRRFKKLRGGPPR